MEADGEMVANTHKNGSRARWVGVFAWLWLSAAAAWGAAIEPVPSSEAPESRQRVSESESICESPRCLATDGGESCTACRVWDYARTSLDPEHVAFESRIVENGVVLRATSQDPQVQQLLWTVSVARHHILELLREGERVPLCAPCRANVRAFAEIEVGTSRLPDGVLLMYTSSNADLVSALHTMLLSGQNLPL